jgi:uncharacterized protein YkwD
MKGLLYGVLFLLILFVGLTIEDTRAPLPLAQAPAPQPLPAATLPETPAVVPAEETETTAADEAPAEPPPLIGAPPPREPAAEAVEYDEAYTLALEAAVHERINVERVRESLGILSYDEELAEIAAYHSTDMAKENYFAHEDEDGCSSSCRLNEAGYAWRLVGENLFLLRSTHHYTVDDAAAIIVAGWMGSAGHRKNVLEGRFTVQGVGVVIDSNSVYATEVFARPR